MSKERKTHPVTWDELATIYDQMCSGRRARTLPMDAVFKWAEDHTDLFIVMKDGTLHQFVEDK